jgi:serine/threonine-protein kinase
VFGPDHPVTAQSMTSLAALLTDRKEVEEAEPLYREALVHWRRTLPAQHPNIATTLDGLCVGLLYRGAYAEAEPLLRECLVIRESISPMLDINRLRAMMMLGESLVGQKKFDEAEPLLLKSIQGFQNHQHAKHRTDAIGHIIRLYQEWNRPADSAKWQAELSLKLPPGP